MLGKWAISDQGLDVYATLASKAVELGQAGVVELPAGALLGIIARLRTAERAVDDALAEQRIAGTFMQSLSGRKFVFHISKVEALDE